MKVNGNQFDYQHYSQMNHTGLEQHEGDETMADFLSLGELLH